MMLPSTRRAALLGADEQDAQPAAALGDVDEQLLDRARALARRVLVELVEHDEAQRLAAAALLLFEDADEERADDEALRGVVQGVDVDDRDRSSSSTGWTPRPISWPSRGA